MLKSLPIILICLCTLAKAQTMHAVVVNIHKDFSIIHEDSLMNEQVNADLRLPIKGNADTLEMNFAKGRVSADTVFIDIHGYHDKSVLLYAVIIVKNRFAITFTARKEKEVKDPPMMRELTRLVLNTLDVKKGKEIRGYTEFIGKCPECDPTLRMIDIRGNFKVLIE